MKAYLMHHDRDVDLDSALPNDSDALVSDLELNTLLESMAQDDRLVFDLSKRALLLPLTEPEAIVYRQEVLSDCLAHPSVIKEIYKLAVEAVTAERRVWGFARQSPDSILNRSVKVTEMFLVYLRRLREITDREADGFRSQGFIRLFEMISKEVDDEYLKVIEAHLKELRFRRGVLIRAELSSGNSLANYSLRRPRDRRLLDRIPGLGRPTYSFQIAERDEHGLRAVGELRGRGINLVANALAQSADHMTGFFGALMSELAFYVGSTNLSAALAERGEPICFPDPLPAGKAELSAKGLYDVCLSLLVNKRVIGNDLEARDKGLVMITGANQGGKSTFLRSFGIAQLMMQSGLFVGAEAFRADICARVFTHFKREEDPSMKSGKFDGELTRMSEIAEEIVPNCVLLCNESFSSTNEREGSEIARQIVRAMTEVGVKVFFVTHLFDLAHGLFADGMNTALFLRAERLPDERRTFRVVKGEPLPTSYGEDSYRRIFGSTAVHSPARGDS